MKVSVVLVTYNHEKWIAQAINSILMQQTTFDYEIVIVEDCSTDGTRDIVVECGKRYPDKIRLLLSKKDKNGNKSSVTTNFARAWQSCPSQYVAWLDGDDYWTSPHKLQSQVDFLDSHPDYAMCFHNVTVLYENGHWETWEHAYGKPKETSTLEDLWAGNFIPGCSSMLRKGLFSEFPDWYYKEQWGDWALNILHARYGKIGYIGEIMGTYRVHSGGAWAGLSKTQQLEQVIKSYQNFNAGMAFRYRDLIDPIVSRCFEELAKEKVLAHVRERKWKQATWALLILLRYYPRVFARAYRKLGFPMHLRRLLQVR